MWTLSIAMRRGLRCPPGNLIRGGRKPLPRRETYWLTSSFLLVPAWAEPGFHGPQQRSLPFHFPGSGTLPNHYERGAWLVPGAGFFGACLPGPDGGGTSPSGPAV
ncbi:hypothetical protein GCM10010387_59770 [Streptomyces inusitatus]|uniref:Uncharacterized protein n=1 Tax=Streptomyces inusitatus TaxID=68221 RepID=A0A918V2C8_9ACTN|nr:hypothetical protein GCM10010387_59770 [Streptomyces inusitatus]